MKKVSLILPCLLFCASFAQGQVVFHEDFQQSDLDVYSTGSIDDSWVLYNDENEPEEELSYLTDAWNVFRDASGDEFAVSPSFFTEAGAEADRWMVSPALDLTALASPKLSFRAMAMDPDNRDGFEVLVSTSGTAKEDFTESLQNTRQARAAWNWYTVDLSAYAGQTIHLAFVQASVDKYLLAIDDIVVYEPQGNGAVVAAVKTPASFVIPQAPASLVLSGEVFNVGAETLQSYDLVYRMNGGQEVRQSMSGLSVASGSVSSFSVEVSMTAPGDQQFSVWVENVNGQSGQAGEATSVGCLAVRQRDMPCKTLFLEVFSSGMCPSCKHWNDSLHPFMLAHDVNDPENASNFVMAKYQVNIPAAGDPAVTDETEARRTYYGISAAPAWMVGGQSFSLTGTGFTYGEKIGQIADSIARFREIPVNLRLRGYLEVEDSVFRISAEITSLLPDPDDYTLQVLLIEDSIHQNTVQHNGEQDFYYPVRKMLPDQNGTLIRPIELGETVTREFEYAFGPSSPQVFSSFDNMAAIVFLQNRTTREIIQAKYLERGVVDHAANESLEASGARLHLLPNPASDYVRLRFESPLAGQAEVQVLDMSGKRMLSRKMNLVAGQNAEEIALDGLQSGLYFVRLSAPSGVYVAKLVVGD